MNEPTTEPAIDAGRMARKIEMVLLNDLVPYANNARTHSPDQVEQIIASIKEFGWTNPILIDGENGIIAGHGRFEAATRLNLPRVPVIKLDHLTDVQKRAYILADNKLALNAGWNEELLADELISLREDGFSLGVMGWTDDELADLLPDEQTSGSGSGNEDEIPEVPQNVRGVQRGQLWQLGNHRLLCGDSTNADDVARLMNGEKADMVFTDPPYNFNENLNIGTKDFKKGHALLKKSNWDVGFDFSKVKENIEFCLSEKSAVYIWNCQFLAAEILIWLKETFHFFSILVWSKTNPYPGFTKKNEQWLFSTEFCFYGHKLGYRINYPENNLPRTCFEYPSVNVQSEGVGHPTPKPIALCEEIITKGSKKSVADLFLGSGSTLIACEKTNRKCYGMEIDPHYCSVILERWEKFSGKKALCLTS